MDTQSARPLSLSPPDDPSQAHGANSPCISLNISQDRCKKREDLLAQDRNGTTISMLPDNVLLEIFDFCQRNRDQYLYGVWKWHVLVQVCRRWRQIVFASPPRLDLQLLCVNGTPVRKHLGIWPAIHIIVEYYHWLSVSANDEDNVIAALEHPDRVLRVRLYITGSELGKIATVMQEPFPVLTRLSISSSSEDRNIPVLPGGFLGGSAPCLQEFELVGIPFPALPTLLLSACGLVALKLRDIPPTGYISPEAMVARLAALPRLKFLHIGFQPVAPRPDQELLPPQTRAVLPALHNLFFDGVCGYLEDFLARIDTPQLVSIVIYYFDQVLDFEVPQLFEFLNRSETLKDTLSGHCQITLDDHDGVVIFKIGGAASDEAERWDPDTGISISVQCTGADRQILHITHVLSWISAILSDKIHATFECDTFVSDYLPELDAVDIEWLPLLRPFSSVQTLFVSYQFAEDISRTLEDIAEVTVAEVLPALELLCLEDQPLATVNQFITVRRDSGHPVTIVNTKTTFEEILKSYP